jgi:hypothetical protein
MFHISQTGAELTNPTPCETACGAWPQQKQLGEAGHHLDLHHQIHHHH